ncbi:formylglycine-generating enzyme family protein [Wenyingzhuangia sp. IMCC45533]
MKYLSLIAMALISTASCKHSKENKTPKIVNTSTQLEQVKKANTSNMIFFDGGKITIGANDRTPLEAPAFEVEVASFYLDKYLVTVADFRKFVEATNFTTEAENFGDSGVFNLETYSWELRKGTTWEYPFGPDEPKAIDNHPVTHVSWNDATAYAKWIGKRLPTEIEWEYAAKNGKNSKYPWGDKLLNNKKIMANTWEGKTIQDKNSTDGFLYTSPIDTFPPSNSGIYDMVGNVWQWTSTIYKPYNKTYYQNIDTNIVVTRGSSFMYDQAQEMSYTTTFRNKNTKESSLFNTGFRCAK